jgi:hypothetical protein
MSIQLSAPIPRIKRLIDDGYPVLQLISNLSLNELKEEQITPNDLYKAGLTVEEIFKLGFTYGEIHEVYKRYKEGVMLMKNPKWEIDKLKRLQTLLNKCKQGFLQSRDRNCTYTQTQPTRDDGYRHFGGTNLNKRSRRRK